MSRLILLAVFPLSLAVACAGAPPVDDAVREEFRSIEARLRAGDNPYFGTALVEDLKRQLDDDTLEDWDRFPLLLRLAERETQLGMLDEATQHIDEAVELIRVPAQSTPPESRMREALAAAHMLRAVAYLRVAEQRNCVAHRNAESCLFPISGSGAHTDTAAAEQAWSSLNAFLQRYPEDLGARWLANLTAMTLGRWPDGLREDLRIDPLAHEDQAGLSRFVDRAPTLGIAGLELAGGVASEDFDGDGYLDLITSTSDPAGSLKHYRNNGDGSYTDRTLDSGLDVQLGGLNLISGDYDNDGDADLLVLRGAWHFADGQVRNSLLRNDAGKFTDVTRAAGLAEPAMPTQAACWADFDNDGDLDLFVGNESWPPLDLDFPSQLFRNEGDGTFSEIAATAGVTNDRYAKGVTVGDYDDDGDVDLYVSNSGANRLYRNDGGMRFTDVAPQLGLLDPQPRSFAPWFFDYDNDGDLDLFVGAYESVLSEVVEDYLGLPFGGPPPALYRNNGDGTFANVAGETGLNRPWMPMGANFGDLDNDGFLDLYLGTGNPNLKTLAPNVALRNAAGARFADITVSTGLGHLQKGHGIAFADFDADGDQDIYHQLGGFYPSDAFGNAWFENPGGGGAQIELEFRGVRSNRLGLGVRVTAVVETPEGTQEFHRAVGSVSSFGGSPLGRLAIGLGSASRVSELRVWWPASGIRSVYRDLAVGKLYRIGEEDAGAREIR